MRTVSRLPAVRRKALATAWPAFPPGALVAGRRAGRLCPQPRLRDGRLLDEALGTGFAVIHSGRTGPALGATLLDARTDPALAGLLGAAGTGALLLRPDRVVAATGDPRSWRALLESAGIAVGPPTAAAPPA
jgi:3-(3-hydroxy-phenyl)propionate hydroxylase